MRLILLLLLPLLALSACSSAESIPPGPTVGAYWPTHNIPIEELGNASAYWNVDWEGRAAQLYEEILAVNTQYFQTHTYVHGKTDCNDMVCEIWGILKSRGIISLIAVGKLEMSQESFLDCDHAWLMVYSGEGSAAALEATSGRIYTWQDAGADPALKQYWEGFIYEEPSDLREDFEERW